MRHFFLFAAAALRAAAPATAASPLEGSWVNPHGNVTVRIAPCGATLCGRVTSASPHAREKAANAGTNQLIGTELMNDIEQVGPHRWQAEIFVPDHNVRASGEIRLEGQSEMLVRGCALHGLVCKTQSWNRVASSPRRPN